MMLWSGSLGIAARLRGDAVPTTEDVSLPVAKDYKLEWKGGGCEQWDSFGGKFLGVGHTVNSCFEGCAARQRNGAFYRENDGLCGCVMSGCIKKNDHEGYQYFDYYIRNFDALDKQGSVQQRMGEMKVKSKSYDQQVQQEMDKGHIDAEGKDIYTAKSTDEFSLEWTGGGCNEWEKLGGRFLGAGHNVKGCSDLCRRTPNCI